MPSGSTIVMGDKKEGTYLTNASVAEVAASDATKIRAIQKWYFDEKSDEDVITLCERYLSSMSMLVYDCREKFDTVAPNWLLLPYTLKMRVWTCVGCSTLWEYYCREFNWYALCFDSPEGLDLLISIVYTLHLIMMWPHTTYRSKVCKKMDSTGLRLPWCFSFHLAILLSKNPFLMRCLSDDLLKYWWHHSETKYSP